VLGAGDQPGRIGKALKLADRHLGDVDGETSDGLHAGVSAGRCQGMQQQAKPCRNSRRLAAREEMAVCTQGWHGVFPLREARRGGRGGWRERGGTLLHAMSGPPRAGAGRKGRSMPACLDRLSPLLAHALAQCRHNIIFGEMTVNDVLKAYPTRLHHNQRAAPHRGYGDAERAVLNEDEARSALHEIEGWPGYQASPLLFLPGLASRAGVGSLAYQDESGRFGLRSFKALGGAYAVYRHLAREVAARTGEHGVTSAALAAGAHRDLISTLTVCCATDGNHGRSVAWGARTFGCNCVIYVHETVSAQREAAIAAYGATVVRNPGNYDEAVHRAARDAEANGWTVVSDTSYEGYTDIPRDVMHGYTVMADEALRAHAKRSVPTHIFVQGGVGGVAAAVCARFWWEYGAQRPRFVVVEPARAACLYESAVAGGRVTLEGDIETVMAGLSCGEPSLLAWDVLDPGTDDFMTVPDEAATDVMRLLAGGVAGDPPLVCGESAGAGLAGMLAALADAPLAAALGLGPDSRVLVFGTEGDTDPELYASIVGRTAEQVREAA